MSTPLATTSFSSKNMSSRVLLASYNVPSTLTTVLSLGVSLTGLNGAAASITLDIEVTRSGNVYGGDRFTRLKRSATSTRELMPLLVQDVEASDTVDVYGVSTNTSDTSVSGVLTVRDAGVVTTTSGDKSSVADAVWEYQTPGLNERADILLDVASSNVDTLVNRVTSARAGYFDKLNVSGTLAHSDAAGTYKADVSGLALETTAQSIKGKTDNLPNDPAGVTDIPTTANIRDHLNANPVPSSNMRGTDGANTTTPLDATATQAAAAAALTAYDPPTRTEATSDKDEILDAISADNAGAGARTVTITVTDGTDPLQNAHVRLTEGANTYSATTDVSGEAIFNVDDATYTVAVTKAGYSFAGVALVVDGDEGQTYAMTANTITPSGVGFSTGYAILYDEDGNLEEGAVIKIAVTKEPSGQGHSFDSTSKTVTSNESGQIIIPGLPIGATITYKRGPSGAQYSMVVPDSPTFELENFIGIS